MSDKRITLGDRPTIREMNDRELLELGQRLAADIRAAQARERAEELMHKAAQMSRHYVQNEDTQPIDLDVRAGWLRRVWGQLRRVV